MKKLFTCLLFLCAVCIWITPAQAAGYDWEKISSDSLNEDTRVYISPLYETDNSLYAWSGSDLYLSRNEGVSWRRISTLPVRYVQVAADKIIYSLQEEANGKTAIYYYDVNREQWHKKYDTPDNTKTFALLANNNSINPDIILTAKPSESSSLWQILRTTDGGQHWTNVGFNRGGYIFASLPDGKTVFTKEYNSGRGAYSINSGETWKQFSQAYDFDKFFVSPDYLKDNKVFATFGRNGIYCSTNQGDNWAVAIWSEATRGLVNNNTLTDIAFSQDYVSDKTIYTADQRGRVYISNTDEMNWRDMGIELPVGITLHNLVALPGNNNLLAGTDNGIYTTSKAAESTLPAPAATQTRTVIAKFRVGVPTYTISGREWDMDAFPYQENDRIYVPVRFMAYSLGINDTNIDWNNKTKEVTITKDNTAVKMKLDSPFLYVNEKEVIMDVTPQMTAGDRVMLPARWVAEAFGASVSWDESQKMIVIQYEESEK